MFLWHLHNKYKTKINFTFGTFLLNLTRSYLDKKYLEAGHQSVLDVIEDKNSAKPNKSAAALLGSGKVFKVKAGTKLIRLGQSGGAVKVLRIGANRSFWVWEKSITTDPQQ